MFRRIFVGYSAGYFHRGWTGTGCLCDPSKLSGGVPVCGEIIAVFARDLDELQWYKDW